MTFLPHLVAAALSLASSPAEATTSMRGYVCEVSHYPAAFHGGEYGADGVLTVELYSEPGCNGSHQARLVYLSEGSHYGYTEFGGDALLGVLAMLRQAGDLDLLVTAQGSWDGTYFWAGATTAAYRSSEW